MKVKMSRVKKEKAKKNKFCTAGLLAGDGRVMD
jgi:hypothetical protein